LLRLRDFGHDRYPLKSVSLTGLRDARTAQSNGNNHSATAKIKNA
jgi:hypothetical protein